MLVKPELWEKQAGHCASYSLISFPIVGDRFTTLPERTLDKKKDVSSPAFALLMWRGGRASTLFLTYHRLYVGSKVWGGCSICPLPSFQRFQKQRVGTYCDLGKCSVFYGRLIFSALLSDRLFILSCSQVTRGAVTLLT